MHARWKLLWLMSLAPAALVSAGCLGYAPPGTVNPPGAPAGSGETRLPQLLQQLQGAGAGLELFDATPSSQVLAAQDTDGGKDDATPSATATSSPSQSPTTISQAPPGTTTPAGAGTPTVTVAVTVTETPASTATPEPTATPTPTIPPEETPPTPPSEGSGAPPPTEQ